MRNFIRPLLLLVLAGLGVWLFTKAHALSGKQDVDGSQIFLLFAGVVLFGGAAAVVFVLMVMPTIGDAIGNLFFQPNQQIEKSPHADALAAVARGDYEAAAEEYGNAFAHDPNDTLALSEMVKLQCERLENPAAGAEALEQAMQREWPPDDAAFLSARLVDVYWTYQHDGRSARALLMQIIEAMPETRYAANAQHRLQEIERQLSLEE